MPCLTSHDFLIGGDPSPFAPATLATSRGMFSAPRSFLRASCDIGGADPLQCEPECDAFINDAPQLLGHRDARILRGEQWQLGQPFRDLAGAWKELVRRNDFVDRPPVLGRLRIELLAGEN